MAGVRGRSGPVGNLNASRHPWRSFWRLRALKAQDRWLLRTLESYRNGLASGKGCLTEVEARTIEIAQTARGATMLILAEAARSGFIVKENGTWSLAPGARELVRFLSVERACLQMLGLYCRTDPESSQAEPTVTFYIPEK